ncbi:Integral membrane protein DGCR2/IDD [Chionoecetes opilio]|nr:Integral membrane protein DGCR2/IDD [Chionoecetes opilio]
MLPLLLLYLVVQGEGEAATDLSKDTKPSKSSWECVSLGGERVANGEMFVPGPDYCTACKCEEGKARVCQAVLCQPPQDCKSFRLGRSCCDFICLDDMLPKLPDANSPSTDLGLRMVASAVTAILSLALLLFLIHRLRQRRLRAQQQYYEDQLDSPIGPNPDSCHNNACCHNAAYCNGNDHVDFFLDGHTPPYSLWKPPSFYFPHEDAPPPYSEVVGNSYRLPQTSTSYPALGPLMVQLGPAQGESSDTNGGAGSLALIGAIADNFRSPCNSPQPPSRAAPNPAKHWEVSLRSDEVYEDIDVPPEDLPPPYYPPGQPLSNLDPSTEAARSNTDRECEAGVQAQDPGHGLGGPEQHPAAGGDSSSNREQSQLGTPVASTRLRAKEGRTPAGPREAGHTATMEQFQLRLSMDMSDSSTSSEVPTRTFSSSSEDSTSMDITSDMR